MYFIPKHPFFAIRIAFRQKNEGKSKTRSENSRQRKKAPCEEHGAGCLEDTPDGDDFGKGGGAYANSVFGGCGVYDSAVAHVDGYVAGVE